VNKTPKEKRQYEEHLDRRSRGHTPNATAMVINYDRMNNTATLIMSSNKTNHPGELLKNVPCPMQPGLQSVAPEVGRLCSVAFKGDTKTNPVITHFFSTDYNKIDRLRHTGSHIDTPRYMLGM